MKKFVRRLSVAKSGSHLELSKECGSYLKTDPERAKMITALNPLLGNPHSSFEAENSEENDARSSKDVDGMFFRFVPPRFKSTVRTHSRDIPNWIPKLGNLCP